jgi:hypothetical protein
MRTNHCRKGDFWVSGFDPHNSDDGPIFRELNLIFVSWYWPGWISCFKKIRSCQSSPCEMELIETNLGYHTATDQDSDIRGACGGF